jgi:hypothetical protein
MSSVSLTINLHSLGVEKEGTIKALGSHNLNQEGLESSLAMPLVNQDIVDKHYQSVSLISCFLAMTVFPGVQKKAQEEIDRIIGPNRLHTCADRENLPYIKSCGERSSSGIVQNGRLLIV